MPEAPSRFPRNPTETGNALPHARVVSSTRSRPAACFRAGTTGRVHATGSRQTHDARRWPCGEAVRGGAGRAATDLREVRRPRPRLDDPVFAISESRRTEAGEG